MALAFHARARPVPGAGRGRLGCARGRLVSQCRLSGGRPRVVEHGNVRHGGHVGGVDDRFERATAATATCTTGNNGTPRAGLDVNNTPNMSWGGRAYHEHERRRRQRGGRPQHHQGRLALHRSRAPDGGGPGALGPRSERAYRHPHGSNGCAAEPTFSQQINAAQYVQTTSRPRRVTRLSEAVAAGYVPVSPTTYPVVYYVNPTIVAANAAAKDPRPATRGRPRFRRDSIGSTGAGGSDVPLALNRDPPMPYGALVQWHQRTDVCGPSSESSSNPLEITGVAPCPAGSVQQSTPYMSMVWQVPVAGGPLAIQPPDIQIVEASVMSAGT